jgi:hypothetical protein
MSEGLATERDRFFGFFNLLVESTNKWIVMASPDKLDRVAIEQESVKYGDSMWLVAMKIFTFTPSSPELGGLHHAYVRM